MQGRAVNAGYGNLVNLEDKWYKIDKRDNRNPLRLDRCLMEKI